MKELISSYVETNKNNPLFLPHGSVRSFLTVILLFVVSYMLVKQLSIPEWYVLIVGNALNGYFLSRPNKPEDKKISEPISDAKS